VGAVDPCLSHKEKTALINSVIAIFRRALSTPCNQGNIKPVVLYGVPEKRRGQKDYCNFNSSSDSCVPTIQRLSEEASK
jgi:hypothetical protein